MKQFDYFDINDWTIGFFERHSADELGITDAELNDIREFRRPFDEKMLKYVKTLDPEDQQSFWNDEKRIEEEFDKNHGIVKP